jgi:hypothetical protein
MRSPQRQGEVMQGDRVTQRDARPWWENVHCSQAQHGQLKEMKNEQVLVPCDFQ